MKIIPLKINNEAEAKELMYCLGVSQQGIGILSPKSVHAAFKIENIKSYEANIIKQHLLSLGSDAAIERKALVKDVNTATIIFGSLSQLKKLCEKLKDQPFTLKDISCQLSVYLDNLFKNEFIFKARNKTIKINKPLICGIINLTTDSFSGDGLLKMENTSFKSTAQRSLQKIILEKAELMIKSGAKIIDLGAESSRPFSKPVAEREEIKRIIPALKIIRKEFKDIVISVDTYKSGVAQAAVLEGVDMINDITALRKCPEIVKLLKKHKLGVILMHMKKNPSTMQINPKYENVTQDIIDFFKERLMFLDKNKINRNCVFLDPGIGFGKTTEDNLKIIKELYKFKIFGLPLFVGLSRKSFIGKILDKEANDRLYGTIAANITACINGANIIRVHDVKAHQEALKILSGIYN